MQIDNNIKWCDIVDPFNRKNNTYYTVSEFIAKAYEMHGSVKAAAEYVGVSVGTFRKYMRIYNIKAFGYFRWKPPGINIKSKFLKIPDKKLEHMSIQQIMNEIGSKNSAHVYTLLKQYDKKHSNGMQQKAIGIVENRLLNIPKSVIKEMTINDIMNTIGAAKSYAYVLVSKHNVEYKRREKWASMSNKRFVFKM